MTKAAIPKGVALLTCKLTKKEEKKEKKRLTIVYEGDDFQSKFEFHVLFCMTSIEHVWHLYLSKGNCW